MWCQVLTIRIRSTDRAASAGSSGATMLRPHVSELVLLDPRHQQVDHRSLGVEGEHATFCPDGFRQVADEVSSTGPEVDGRHPLAALEQLDDLLGPLPLVARRVIEVMGVGLRIGKPVLGAARLLMGCGGAAGPGSLWDDLPLQAADRAVTSASRGIALGVIRITRFVDFTISDIFDAGK